MNKSDSDRIHELCSLIAVEQNREKFLQLVEELNRILSAHETRFPNTSPEEEENDQLP
jgi:hypothetical protein